MKRFASALALGLVIMSCGNENASSETTNDTVGTTNPTAIDTTQHPNGMTNGSVISTDTAAISLDNTGNVNGGDSSNPK